MNSPGRAIVSILGLIILMSTQICIAYAWKIETLDPDIIGENPKFPSIDLDSSGRPNIAYWCDLYVYHILCYAIRDGGGWQVDNEIEISDHQDIGKINLELDSQDKAHICYQIEPGGSVRLAVFTAEQWNIEDIPGSYLTQDWSFALDSQNHPHVSFGAEDQEEWHTYLSYAYKQDDGWVVDIIDYTPWAGDINAIAVDSQDYPHIIYDNLLYDMSFYIFWDGSSWERHNAGGGSYRYSIAMDQQDQPHVILGEYGLAYMYWDGTDWIYQGVDGISNQDDSPKLVLDSQGLPHISYSDYSSGELKYAYFEGSEWLIETVDTQCPPGAEHMQNDLVLNELDQPYIIYNDYSGHLKLAWLGGYSSVNLLSFTAQENKDNTVVLNWSVETTGGEQIAGFNLYRREIAPNSVAEVPQPPQNKDDWTRINLSLITGQNPYAYTDANVQGDLTYEYKLDAVLAYQTAETLGKVSCTLTPSAFTIVKLYPNPVSDTLNVNLSLATTGEVTLSLCDLIGRLVQSQTVQAENAGEMTAQMDVSVLSTGVYTLRASQNGAEMIARVVVAR